MPSRESVEADVSERVNEATGHDPVVDIEKTGQNRWMVHATIQHGGDDFTVKLQCDGMLALSGWQEDMVEIFEDLIDEQSESSESHLGSFEEGMYE